MLLEIMCIVILSLIYLVARLKEIDFPAIAPTLRQMQYERLSYRRYWKIGEGGSFIILNNPATFRFTDSPVIIAETSTPSIFDWINESIQCYRENEIGIGDRSILLEYEADLSEKVAKGEIKPRGKSVSVEEVIAKIDENLKE